MASKRRAVALVRDTLPRRCYSQATHLIWRAPTCPNGASKNVRQTAITPPLSRQTQRVERIVQSRQYASSNTADDQDLRKTPLYDLHVSKGAQMVPFGGYHMPVQYKDQSVVESHNWTREKASLFDVSHMVQYHISGPGASSFLSLITPSSLSSIKEEHSTLSCLLHPGTGGIVDDTIITKLKPDLYYVVLNAGNRDKDYEYLTTQLKDFNAHSDKKAELVQLDKKGLLAIQGPLAVDILESILLDSESANLKELYFGQCRSIRLLDEPNDTTYEVLASRGGYTGEDGFELSVASNELTNVAELLLNSAGNDKLRFAGLAARDSLRLEAGMCLYGNDLDDTTTPIEAGLSWVVGKDRRATGGFHGASVILEQLKPIKQGGRGPPRRRVGLIVEGAPARHGHEIVDQEGNSVGVVTSGCPSPTMKKNIAMGYVENGHHKSGTELGVLVRKKTRKAVVTKMPFVASKYFKGSQSPG